MKMGANLDMLKLREALEASWQADTANLNVQETGNPALGQCYPTSRVVQYYYPATEIVEGEVWTGKSIEKHFWNILIKNGVTYHIDFTWQQFPQGSVIRKFKVLNREKLADSPQAIKRVELLHQRVKRHLGN